jgi:DNA mismatch repair protein MSH6
LQNAFDHKAAISDGKIQPSPGVDKDYDAAFKEVANLQKEADTYLKEVKEKLRTKVVYFGSDKKRYQLEVSDKVRVPHDYEMTSSRKGFKRYSTARTKVIMPKLIH